MFKEGKETISVDNKEFIRLSDAMQVIAPTTSNAARWFQQHQEAFMPETFVYSDERFPGKKNRVWLTVPEGFHALYQACVNAPRLKIPEGVEDRIAPFLSAFRVPKSEEAGMSCPFDKDFPSGCSEASPTPKAYGQTDKKMEKEEDNGQNTPLVEEADNEVDVEFYAIDDTGVEVRKHAIEDADSPNQPRGIVYQEPQEKMILPTSELPNSQFRIPNSEEWVEFLQQLLSDLVAKYYTKICWLKRAQTEAPEEIHAAFADLTNTLHDILIENVIVDILKYKIPVKGINKEPKAPGALDQVEKYLSMGYEISFEADKEGILCCLLSEAIGVNVVAANWCEALVEAIKQIPVQRISPTPDSLYVSKSNGSVELVNDIGEIK